jgi:pimeloyl-ACP methyl ester carboxylesterase
VNERFVEQWGSGVPVILVHGSLAIGAEEWHAQRPLAGEGFQLLVPDRRGYGQSPSAHGEDFLLDAEDIAALLGDGAHLVGHSYGGLGVLFAAARRPEAVRSIALLEAPTFTLGKQHPAARQLVDGVRSLWGLDLPDEDWVVRFLASVGSDPATLPPGLVASLLPLVPLVRNARLPWDCEPPFAELASAPFPKLVISGGHSAGFDAICDELAARIGASRMQVAGAGHEIQFAGEPLNQALLSLWRTAS